MTIDFVIEQCWESAHTRGWNPEKQTQFTADVMRRLRPEWSDSQIYDTIDRVRGLLAKGT